MSDIVHVPGNVELVPSAPLPADRNPAAVYLASLTTSASRRTMRSALRAIALLLGQDDPLNVPWHLMRYQHVAAIQARLIGPQQTAAGDEALTADVRLSPVTVRHRLAALRGVLKQAWLLGLMDAEDYYRAREIKRVEGSRLSPGRQITDDELAKLFAACAAPGLRNARDSAVLGLLCAGLRRTELVDLDLGSFDQVLGDIIVLGKRNKQRKVRLPPGVQRAVRRWLKYRADAPGPLILPLDAQHRCRMARCCEKVVPGIIRRLGRDAGVSGFTAHDFRRTLVSNLIDQGVDMARIQRIVGHESVETTVLYDRRDERKTDEVMDGYHVPVTFWEETKGE